MLIVSLLLDHLHSRGSVPSEIIDDVTEEIPTETMAELVLS
jgi:hypothetical protein